MKAISYSVIIRTTGKANEKYQKLLNSIRKLEPQPEEVIVVLPEGYSKPKEQLGDEKFYFSPKGMVAQRMKGIEECRTRYALICDDDVCFRSDFVQKLYKPICQGLCAFSAGPLYSFLPAGKGVFLDLMMGNAAPTFFHKERYVSVMRTSGYSYNRHLEQKKKYYETQSVAWTCFFADIEALKSIDFESESWLDSHGYSALDDQTMFYKAYLRGLKTMVVVNAVYEHLDARTSTRNNKPAALYSMGYNRVVFWNRFIYAMQPNGILRCWSRLCFAYKNFMTRLYEVVSVMVGKRTKEDYKIIRKGQSDGWRYIRSEEYLNLPPV